MSAPEAPVRLLPLAEATRLLSVSLRSLRTLAAAGRIPVVRVTQRRIPVAEVDLAAFVASRREARA